MDIARLMPEGYELKDIGPVQHHFCGGVYAKQMMLQAGYVAVTHKHNYDHMSVLVSGSVELHIDDAIQVFQAPAVIEIVAGKEHGIRALSDVTWLCIHRIPEGMENIDDVLIEAH
jgi:quercetin dioxygenase-like cupin family protein